MNFPAYYQNYRDYDHGSNVPAHVCSDIRELMSGASDEEQQKQLTKYLNMKDRYARLLSKYAFQIECMGHFMTIRDSEHKPHFDREEYLEMIKSRFDDECFAVYSQMSFDELDREQDRVIDKKSSVYRFFLDVCKSLFTVQKFLNASA